MTTFTMNRALDSNDFLLAMMNGNTYADLQISRSVDSESSWAVDTGDSFGNKIKRFFLGK